MRISDWSSDVCSSDLQHRLGRTRGPLDRAGIVAALAAIGRDRRALRALQRRGRQLQPVEHAALGGRSEEHTSELQSLMRISYAVFCLKKKKTHNHKYINHITMRNNVSHVVRQNDSRQLNTTIRRYI